MKEEDYNRFSDIGFTDFREMAKDKNLSKYEKIGFPDSYRKGREESIYYDIVRKLPNLGKKNKVVLDIGPGCSDLPRMLIDLCREQDHTLLLIDSKEMLDLLPDEPFITKIPARYPDDCLWIFEDFAGKVDVILTYSVLHYVFDEGNLFEFLDRSLQLLARQGEMLIGDIPNISKRKRFFSSPTGTRYHKEFTQSDDVINVEFNKLESGKIDDSVLISIVLRSRLAGFDAYLIPQSSDLPMANRREDIFITRS